MIEKHQECLQAKKVFHEVELEEILKPDTGFSSDHFDWIDVQKNVDSNKTFFVCISSIDGDQLHKNYGLNGSPVGISCQPRERRCGAGGKAAAPRYVPERPVSAPVFGASAFHTRSVLSRSIFILEWGKWKTTKLLGLPYNFYLNNSFDSDTKFIGFQTSNGPFSGR